jgi:hypothetical protein
MKLSTFTFLLLTTALGLGCSAQVDPDYPGEPLGRVHGALVTGSTPAPAGMEVAILYYGFGPNWERQSLGVSVPISATSPGTFEMDIFSPPPPEAFGPLAWPEGATGTGPAFEPRKWTVGYIVALAPDTDKSHVRPENILGVSLDYHILYFAEDAAPGSYEEFYASQYAVPGTKGYQLSAVYPLTLPERAAERAAYDQCRWLPGLCVWQEDDINTREYDTSNWDYDDCMKRVPTPESCTTYNVRDVTPEQTAESNACQQKMRDAGIGSQPPCPRGPTAKPNPLGMSAPITVTMGATLLDAITQQY